MPRPSCIPSDFDQHEKVFLGDLKWDRAAVTAEILGTLTKEEVLELVDKEIMAPETSKRVSSTVFCFSFFSFYTPNAMMR